jgi:hypothetical protein
LAKHIEIRSEPVSLVIYFKTARFLDIQLTRLHEPSCGTVSVADVHRALAKELGPFWFGEQPDHTRALSDGRRQFLASVMSIERTVKIVRVVLRYELSRR